MGADDDTLQGDRDVRADGSVDRVGGRIGRYVVLGKLGAGGNGAVYTAFDPELDRKIAIKLLRAAAGKEAVQQQVRLQREAQAIARVSHPNVIAVYDVGTVEDRLFVAMELVEGETLHDWIERGPHGHREVLKLFVQAARGLEAAHGAGLVHRDFKPANVIIGRDGRVRVLDFGLARPVDRDWIGDDESDIVTADTELSSSSSGRRGLLEEKFTATGALVGTPAYMAPEQFLRLPTDARTDQFSFCVALHEALYQEEPFQERTLHSRTLEVTQGKIVKPAREREVPAWLRPIVARGLAPDPNQRWPSMTELIAALEHDPERIRRRIVAAAAALVLVAGGAVGASLWARHAARGPCAASAARLDGIWDATRRRSVQAAFAALGGDAARAFAPTAATLDRYAAAWTEMSRDACEATNVRHEQSAELLDLRNDCLEQRLGELRATTELLAHPDASTVPRALDAASSLPTVEACGHAVALRAVVPPPRDLRLRARIGGLHAELAKAHTIERAQRFSELRAKMPPLIAEARAIGYAPLLAETLNLQAHVELDEMGRSGGVAIVKTALDAFRAAERGRDDSAAALALYYLSTSATVESVPEEGLRLLDVAAALLERAGGDVRLQSWIENDSGMYFQLRGDLETALSRSQRALALKRQLYGTSDHPDVAESLNNIGSVLTSLGRYAEARAAFAEGLAIMDKTVGEDASYVTLFSNSVDLLLREGHAAEALQQAQRGAAICARRESPTDLEAVAFLELQGRSRVALGEPREAAELLRLALSRVGPAANSLAPALAPTTRFALARATWDLHQPSAARALAAQARGEFSALGAGSKLDLAEVDGWLAAHRR